MSRLPISAPLSSAADPARAGVFGLHERRGPAHSLPCARRPPLNNCAGSCTGIPCQDKLRRRVSNNNCPTVTDFSDTSLPQAATEFLTEIVATRIDRIAVSAAAVEGRSCGTSQPNRRRHPAVGAHPNRHIRTPTCGRTVKRRRARSRTWEVDGAHDSNLGNTQRGGVGLHPHNFSALIAVHWRLTDAHFLSRHQDGWIRGTLCLHVALRPPSSALPRPSCSPLDAATRLRRSTLQSLRSLRRPRSTTIRGTILSTRCLGNAQHHQHSLTVAAAGREVANSKALIAAHRRAQPEPPRSSPVRGGASTCASGTTEGSPPTSMTTTPTMSGIRPPWRPGRLRGRPTASH